MLERRDAVLLALLALNGPTLRSRAASLLWPDLDGKAARSNLRQRLFRLHRLTTRPLLLADKTLRIAGTAAVDLHGARALLAASPEACTGELLGGHDYSDSDTLDEWVQAAREEWRRERLNALAAEASRCEAAMQIVDALNYARRIVAEDPLHEHGHRRLMRLHYLRGDRSAALNAARQCEDVLRSRLGLTPDRETLQLLALIESADAASQRAPVPHAVATLRPPRLIGREHEWIRLESICQAQRVGVVQGEPGIGKTRLLADFAGAQNAPVIGVLAGDDRLPYALLARVVRALLARHGDPGSTWVREELARVVPELGAPGPGALRPLRLMQATTAAFDTWHTAGLSLVVIDDLHYADAATLQMLPALVTGGSGTTPSWLIGVRSNEIPRAAATWFDSTDSRTLERITLAPLDERCVAALLESMAITDLDATAWAPHLTQHTGGNPLFIVETMIAWSNERTKLLTGARPALPMPLSAGELIERRLKQLAPQALRLARVAAIAGQDFSVRLASTVLGQGVLDIAGAWSELEAAHVVCEDRFAHDLVRDGVLRSIPKSIARELHDVVAAALEADDATPPARIGDHWFAAGTWSNAAQAYLRAARQAHDASRMGDAGPLFGRAADCHARCSQPSEQSQALQEVIGCLLKQHDIAGAKAVAARLPELAGNDHEARAWAHDRLGEISNIARDDHATVAAVRAMLAAAPDSDNNWIRFNGTRKLAIALAQLGRFDESLSLFDSQSDWLRTYPHEWNVHVWYVSHGASLELADRRAQAIATLDNAVNVARMHENWYCVYAASRERALCRYWLGDLQTASIELASALKHGDRLGDGLTTDNPRDASVLAALLRDAGRHTESLEWLQRSVATLKAGASPFWLAYAENQLALGYLEVGQIARARALVADEPGCENIDVQAMRLLTRARCLRMQTGRPAPDSMLAKVFRSAECPRRWRLLGTLEASYALTSAEARAVRDDVAIEATQHQFDGVAMHARMLAAWAALNSGDAGNAQADLRGTLSMADNEARNPTGISLIAWWWIGIQVFDGLGLKGEADALVVKAARQLRTIELPLVPEEFRRSFLDRNPVHRNVLARHSRI